MLIRLLLVLCAGVAPLPCAAGTKADLSALRRTAMNQGGDARRGKAVYLSAAARCAACHKIHGQGGAVGPDLSQVGGKFDRTHLIESILDPSAEIPQGYHATIIETRAGRVLTGIVKAESAKVVTLLDAEGKSITVAPGDIASRTVSKVSLMPAGLADRMTPGEFTDMIAYLASLRTGRAATPGERVGGPLTLPAGFKADVVARGLTGATAMAVTRDGRIFVCEQTGTLRVIKHGRLLAKPFLKVPVDATWERGLIGVTVAPDFPKTPHVFVCYVAAKPYPHHVVSRFTAAGDVAQPESEKKLLEGDDQRKLGGTVPAGHQGGAIHFGKDDKLYIAIGDQTAGTPAQAMNSLLGRLLRIEPDGAIPADNPFVKKAAGKYRATWRLACAIRSRSPCSPRRAGCSSTMWAATRRRSTKGSPAPTTVGRPSNTGRPPTGASAARSTPIQPRASPAAPSPRATSAGRSNIAASISSATSTTARSRSLDPAKPAVARSFATGLRRPVDLRFAADGSLYVLLRDAWVRDNLFKGGTGALLRIRYIAARKLRSSTPTGKYRRARGASQGRADAWARSPLARAAGSPVLSLMRSVV